MVSLLMEKELIYKAIIGGGAFTAAWWITSYLLKEPEYTLGLIGGIIFATTWLIVNYLKNKKK